MGTAAAGGSCLGDAARRATACVLVCAVEELAGARTPGRHAAAIARKLAR